MLYPRGKRATYQQVDWDPVMTVKLWPQHLILQGTEPSSSPDNFTLTIFYNEDEVFTARYELNPLYVIGVYRRSNSRAHVSSHTPHSIRLSRPNANHVI
jgi:hypothetical protein